MEKRITGPQNADFESLEADFDDVSGITGDVQDELDSILSSMDADANDVTFKISVSRDAEGNSVGAHLFDCGPREFENIRQRLIENYGSGRYQARIYRNKKLFRRKIIEVEAPKNAVPISIPQQSQIGEIANLISRQNEQLANIMQRGAPSAAPSDPIAMMTAMMGAMVQMKEFLTPAQPANAGSSIKDFMEMLAFAKEIVADGGGGGRSAFDLAAEFLKSPIAGELAEQFKAQRATPIAGTPPVAQLPAANAAMLTHSRPIPAQAPAATPQALPMPEILASFDQATLAQMKQQVDFWVSRAAKDSDPGLYAELLLDTLPTEFAAFFINRSDLMEAVAFLNPAASQYPQWFAELKDAVNHILTADGDGEDKDGEPGSASGTSAGDNSHVFEPIRQPAAVHPNGDTIGAGGSGGDVGDHVAVGKGRKKDASGKGKGGRAN